ncbi:LuxR C-terminal-related transcriptional regulator [Bacteroides fragilis]
MRLKAELSPRESEIAELLAWGASKKEVADRLFISARTVENTARNIYQKIGIQKATELCVWWFCTKCGVPVSLDPLKRAFIAVLLLIAYVPRECVFTDDCYTPRTTRTARTTRVARRLGRRGEDEAEYNNFLTTTA